MKFAKKFLTVCLVAVFLVQSLGLTPAIAKSVGEKPVDGFEDYKWTASMSMAPDSPGVSNISCTEGSSVGKLKWTVDLYNSELWTSGLLSAGGAQITLTGDNLTKMNDIRYEGTAYPDKGIKKIDTLLNAGNGYTSKIVDKWKQMAINYQKLTFETDSSLKEFSFQLAYDMTSIAGNRNLNTISVKIRKDQEPQTTPVSIYVKEKGGTGKLSGEVNVQIDNRVVPLQANNGVIEVPGVTDGSHRISVSKYGYEISPDVIDIDVHDGKVWKNGSPYTDNTINLEYVVKDTGGSGKDRDDEGSGPPVNGTLNDKTVLKYKEDGEGTYPEDYVQNKNIRNYNTKPVFAGSPYEDYCLNYSDALVGKWAEPVKGKDDVFDIHLKIRGKTYRAPKGLDVVLVLDNSTSMAQNFAGSFMAPNSPRYVSYKDSKIWSLYSNTAKVTKELLDGEKDIRVGVVNFSTLVPPFEPADYITDHKAANGNANAGYYNPAPFLQRNGFTAADLKKVNNFWQAYGTDSDLENYLATYSNSMRLSNDLSDVLFTLPVLPRGKTRLEGAAAEFGANVGMATSTTTNIAAGINAGGEILYADNPDRQKVMVLITDGMPTASFRLKDLDMPYKNFNDNLAYENYSIYKSNFINADVSYPGGPGRYFRNMPEPLSTNEAKEQIKSLISTNSIPFMTGLRGEGNAIYRDAKGRLVYNNMQGTKAVRDFYVRNHPDMRIMSLFIGDDNLSIGNFVEDLGNSFIAYDGQYEPGRDPRSKYEKALTYPNPGEFMRTLVSPGKNNYYTVKTADELASNLKKIGEDIIKTINNGTVTDPMGDQVILMKDSDNSFMPGNARQLEEGSCQYYLKNNQGHYLDYSVSRKTTVVRDEKTDQEVKGYSTLAGVTVTTEYNPKKGVDEIKINNLTLGEGEEVELVYRVKLKSIAEGTKPNFYYQANKETTLEPRPGSYKRQFPIPSVMLPQEQGERSFVKQDKADGRFLKDAQFALYRINGGKKEFLTSKNGSYSWAPEKNNIKDIQNLKIFTSGRNGEFTVDKLDYGTYYLMEVAAPKGYELPKNPIEFTVDKNSSGARAVVVKNQKLPSFPYTGGGGTDWFTFLGALIIIMSIYAGWKMKSRKENGL